MLMRARTSSMSLRRIRPAIFLLLRFFAGYGALALEPVMPSQSRLVGQACNLIDDDAFARRIVVGCRPIIGEGRLKVLVAGCEQMFGEIDEEGALTSVNGLSLGARHHEGGDDAL